MNNVTFRVAGQELEGAIHLANRIDCDGHADPKVVAQSMMQMIPELNAQEGDIIGVSFSGVVSAIMDGSLPEERLAFIISTTTAPDQSGMESLISYYGATKWRRTEGDQFGAEGIVIARRLLKAGKVVQPRLSGFRSHACTRGVWFKKGSEYGDMKL